MTHADCAFRHGRGGPRPICTYLPLDVAVNFGSDSTDARVDAWRPRLLEVLAPLNLPAMRGLALASGTASSLLRSSWPPMEWRPLPSLLTGSLPLCRDQSMACASHCVNMQDTVLLQRAARVARARAVNSRL